MKMTISLLQSYDWLKICPDYLKAKAKQQIIGMLRKEPFDNTATARGNAYEEVLCKALRFGQPVHPTFEVLRGKRQQGWIQPLTLEGYTFRGKMDFDDANEIWDVKTTSKMDLSSYYDKLQHDVYALAENKNKFTYLVAVFPDKDGLEPTSVEPIPLTLDLKASQDKVIAKLKEFESFLNREALWELYFETFNGGIA